MYILAGFVLFTSIFGFLRSLDNVDDPLSNTPMGWFLAVIGWFIVFLESLS